MHVRVTTQLVPPSDTKSGHSANAKVLGHRSGVRRQFSIERVIDDFLSTGDDALIAEIPGDLVDPIVRTRILQLGPLFALRIGRWSTAVLSSFLVSPRQEERELGFECACAFVEDGRFAEIEALRSTFVELAVCHGDFRVRRNAADFLFAIRSNASFDFVREEALKHGATDFSLGLLLARLGDPQAVPLLIDCLRHRQSARIAHEALVQLTARDLGRFPSSWSAWFEGAKPQRVLWLIEAAEKRRGKFFELAKEQLVREFRDDHFATESFDDALMRYRCHAK